MKGRCAKITNTEEAERVIAAPPQAAPERSQCLLPPALDQLHFLRFAIGMFHFYTQPIKSFYI